MLRRLRDAGAIGEVVRRPMGEESPAMIEREALLVYAGTFLAKGDADNPDGIEVVVTPEQIKALVTKHNSMLGKIKRFIGNIVGDSMVMKYFPPIQLDHTYSAWDTVGRLVGDLKLVQHKHFDGTEVPGVMGTVRILGKENVERVNDGRWTHLSIGADFDNSRIQELTITPFPAAGQASFLTGQQDKKVTSLTALRKDIRVAKLRADVKALHAAKKNRELAISLLSAHKENRLSSLRESIKIDVEKSKRICALRDSIRCAVGK